MGEKRWREKKTKGVGRKTGEARTERKQRRKGNGGNLGRGERSRGQGGLVEVKKGAKWTEQSKAEGEGWQGSHERVSGISSKHKGKGPVEIGSPPTWVPLGRFWALAVFLEKHGVLMSWSRREVLW